MNYHKKALEILVNVHVDHEPMLRWIAVHNPAAFVAAFEATRAGGVGEHRRERHASRVAGRLT
jgi:hypothetical protein